MVSSKNDDRSPRGRPRGFDETEALEKAMLTFWRGGYNRTSLDDLVDATGASRASLYSVFGDKRALFEKSLALYGERFSDRVDVAVDAAMSGQDRVEMVLNASADRLVSSDAPPGCLRCNSTLELGGADPAMDAVLQRANDAFVATMARLVGRAVEQGEVPPDRARALTLLLTAIVNGMVTLARSGASRADLADVIGMALRAWPDGNTRAQG